MSSLGASSCGPSTPQHPGVFPRRGTMDYGAFFTSSGSMVLGDTDLSDKYIPSSTDKVTSADHRPLDEIFGGLSSSRSQLSAPERSFTQHCQPRVHPYPHQHQGMYSQHHTQHTQPSREYGHLSSHRHVPPLILRQPQLRPPACGLLHIPLMQVDNQRQGSDLVINFRCWERGMPMDGMSCLFFSDNNVCPDRVYSGVSMSELLHDQEYMLERGRDCVLDGSGITKMKLNIIWPGYPPFVRTISPILSDGRAITRTGLGYEVALAFSAFFCEVGKSFVQRSHPGPFTIAHVQNGNSLPGVRFDRLRLFSVRETSLGEWTPEVSAVVAGSRLSTTPDKTGL
ncbi:hypothetical protein V8B97DRAFT_1948419 [Scleroderma yunnanense]